MPPRGFRPPALWVSSDRVIKTWPTRRVGFFLCLTLSRQLSGTWDHHHCVYARVGLTFHPTSTRIGDGNHVAADSADHDRRCDGVDRERVGARGGRIGGRVNPPLRRTGGRPLGAVAERIPPRRPSRDGSAARCPGTCFVSDEAPPPGVVRNANSWYGFTNQRGHPGNGMEFPRTG